MLALKSTTKIQKKNHEQFDSFEIWLSLNFLSKKFSRKTFKKIQLLENLKKVKQKSEI